MVQKVWPSHTEGDTPQLRVGQKPMGVTLCEAGIWAHSSFSHGQNQKHGLMKPLQMARKQPLALTNLRKNSKEPEKPRGPQSSWCQLEVKVRMCLLGTGKFQKPQSGGQHPA